MTLALARLVQKLWSDCQVLRDDGLSYQDYLDQLSDDGPGEGNASKGKMSATGRRKLFGFIRFGEHRVPNLSTVAWETHWHVRVTLR